MAGAWLAAPRRRASREGSLPGADVCSPSCLGTWPLHEVPVTPTQAYEACQQLHAAKSRSLCLVPENSPRVDPAKLRLTSGPWI